MLQNKSVKAVIYFVSLIIIVVGLSIVSNRAWGGKPVTISIPGIIVGGSDMTLKQFGQANGFSDTMLKHIFELKTPSDLEKGISSYGSKEEVVSLVKKRMALAAEESGKNWRKIAVKFTLWFIFLTFIFIYVKKRKVSMRLRNFLLFISLFIFGIVLGSDPAPMGTVKDAVHLFAVSGTIFPPRMIALAVFLLMVFIANKYICAWGCQAGTLQDLVFRINRDSRHKPVIWRQFKLPFAVTNTFRILFFIVFTVIAFLWGFDIIEPFDLFKVYNPAAMGIVGIIFTAALLVSALFIYRPWCHMFCPFGLTGWIVEKISRIRISVDYNTCIACKRCADACPSAVMKSILLRNTRTISDCFACYTCRDACPTGSIKFSTRKRTLPPAGHFDKTSTTPE